MFSAFYSTGYTFLKNVELDTRDINPELIRKLVEADFSGLQFSSFSIPKKKPIKHNPFEEGTLLADPHTDITKSFTAFGRLAIPKLRKQLLHHDLYISRQAIITLLDLVHDPEKAVECVRLNVLARLVRLMLSEDLYSRQHTHCILKVIASQPWGPQAIIEKEYLIRNLKITIMNEDNMTRLQAAMTCMYLSRSWPSCGCLVKAGFVDRILGAIFAEKLTSVLIITLIALKNLLEKSVVAIQDAVENRVCEILISIIKHKCPQVRSAAIGVLANVFVSKEGKVAGEKCSDLIPSLMESLDDTDEDVIQEASTALAFLFVTTPSKFRGGLDALHKLLPLALCSKNIVIATHAIQAITNLAALPAAKEELLHNYLDHINKINTQNDPQLITCKSRLIEVVTHVV